MFLKLKSIKISYLSILAAVFGFLKFELKKRLKCLNAVKRRLRFIENSLPMGALSAYAKLAEFRPMHLQSLKLLCPRVSEEMHLQETYD